MDLSVINKKEIKKVINNKKIRDIDKLWFLEAVSEHVIDETGKTDIKIDGEDFIYVDLFLQGYVKPENGKIVATAKGKALLNELR
jgi:hypothetical protein